MIELIIRNNQKGNFNDQIKILRKKFPLDDIPVLSENGIGIWETPNSNIADRLIKMGICETQEDIKKNRSVGTKVVKSAKVRESKKVEHEFYTVSDKGQITYKRTKIAEYLTDKYHARIIPNKKYMFIYNFDIKYYQIDYGTTFETDINMMFGDMINVRETSEIMNKVWTYKPRHVLEDSLFWINDQYINFDNGVLNLDTMELDNHDPDKYYFQSIIPHKYNPDAKCPNILELLGRVFTTKQTFVEDQLEWFGFCLSPGYRFKMINIYIGDSDTGKTTWFRIITECVGNSNKSIVEPNEMTIKHQIATLLGKMINISSDIGKDKIKNFNMLRVLSGGDPVTGRELYKNPFEFINQAKLIISCNEMPNFDGVQASYNRINIIHCDHVFTLDDTKNFNYNDYNTEEEMSGLINEGIRAYKNTIKRGGFNKCDSESTADEHNFLVNSMTEWASEELKWCDDDESGAWMIELELDYINWCNRRNMKPTSRGPGFTRKFREEFKTFYYTNEKRPKNVNGMQKVRVLGVKFKRRSELQ